MSAPAAERRNGLTTVIDMIVSPSSAFANLRVAPTWGWAFLIAAVLATIGSLITAPTVAHVMQTTMPAQLAANPSIASLPPDQQQTMIARTLAISKVVAQFSFVFLIVGILIAGLIQGLIMMIANAIGHGDGSFKKYFALSVNVSVIGLGISSVVVGIIVLLRGADSFDSTTAVQSAVPSLALLVPGAKGALAGFLGTFHIFALWATALLALGMTGVGRVPRGVAWGTSIAMLLLFACFGAWGGAQNH
jgi:hypothetical protein